MSYLCDIFGKLNTLNKELQGKHSTLVFATAKIFGFISKLHLYKSCIDQSQYDHFPALQQCSVIPPTASAIISDHLVQLHSDFMYSFSDLQDFIIPDWLTQPFLVDLKDVEVCLQDEMADLKHDIDAQILFKNKSSAMWYDDILC